MLGFFVSSIHFFFSIFSQKYIVGSVGMGNKIQRERGGGVTESLDYER